MPSGFVTVDDAFVHHRVDDRDRCFQLLRSFVLVTGADRIEHILHRGAQARTRSHVLAATLDGLTSAFFR